MCNVVTMHIRQSWQTKKCPKNAVNYYANLRYILKFGKADMNGSQLWNKFENFEAQICTSSNLESEKTNLI